MTSGPHATPLAIRNRRWILIAALLIGLAAIPGLLKLDVHNHPRDFFIAGSAASNSYQRFEQTFGSDQVVRVAFRVTASPAETVRTAGEFEQIAGRIDGVAQTIGLRSHHEPRVGYWPPEGFDFESWWKTPNLLDRQLGLRSQDDQLLSVLVVLATDDAERQARALEQLESAAGERGALVAGIPLLDRALDRSAAEVTNIYFPLLMAIALLILSVVFRQLRAVLIPLAMIALTLLLSVAAIGFAGVRVHLLLTIVPPLIFTITLATSVHVLMRFRDLESREGLGPLEAARATLREKRRAIAFGVLNTIAGCGSLLTSMVRPVREFGIWSSFGVAVMGILALLFLPALLASSGHRLLAARGIERRFEGSTGRWARRLTEWCTAHRGRVLIGSAVLLACALAGLPGLETRSHALDYLRPSHPVRAAIDELATARLGVSTLELMVEAQQPISVTQLAEASARLRQIPAVQGVLSAADLVDDLAQSMFPRGAEGTSHDPTAVALRSLQTDEAGARALRALWTEDRRAARLTVFVPTPREQSSTALRQHIWQAAQTVFARMQVTPTGQEQVLLETQSYLLHTLLVSFGSAVVVIYLGFCLLLKSVRLALVALAPNVIPIAIVFGVMGWFGIALDVGTAMVGSIVLGLAVDDTVHTMVHFRELTTRHGRDAAIALTLESTAPAYLLSGSILVCGFGVLMFSSFLPTARFGGLCAVSVIVAVLAELLLVPSLFSLVPERSIQRR